MDLLQQVPPSAHRANGSLDADLPIMRRRRGRRKNVEGLELLFMGNKRAGGVCVRETVIYSQLLPRATFNHFSLISRMMLMGQIFQEGRGFRMPPNPTDQSVSLTRAPMPTLWPPAAWRRRRRQFLAKTLESG